MRVYIAKLIIQIIIIWISTIVVSKGMDNYRKIKLYKDVADKGYKFNYKTLIEEENKNIQTNEKEVNNIFDKILNMYPKVPFINILQAINDAKSYGENIEEVIYILKQKDLIEKMTEREIKEYSKNKTGKNAKRITEDTYMRILNANELYFEDADSNFIYEVNEELNDITILKVTGRASYLSEEEQKNIVIDFWQETIIGIMSSFGSLENFREYTEENQNKEINLTETIKQHPESTKTEIKPLKQPTNESEPKKLIKK